MIRSDVSYEKSDRYRKKFIGYDIFWIKSLKIIYTFDSSENSKHYNL